MKVILVICAIVCGIAAFQMFDGRERLPVRPGQTSGCFQKFQLLCAKGYADHAIRCLSGDFKNERQAYDAKAKMWANAEEIAFKPMDEVENTVLKGKWTAEKDAELSKRWSRDLDPSLE
jgi:hypothetical protein